MVSTRKTSLHFLDEDDEAPAIRIHCISKKKDLENDFDNENTAIPENIRSSSHSNQ